METTKKIRVVFYARVSTEHEAQINAFENQIEWYKAELLHHPEWELVDIYSDKGVTGTSVKKRDGFMQMYADAKVRFHDFRHTFATIALQNGVDIKTVSGMLGHFSAGFTLDTYAHVTTSAQKEAAQTMGNVLSM